jgi:phage-related protein
VPSQAEIDLIVNATNTLADLQRDIRRIVSIAEATAPPVHIRVDVDRDGALQRATGLLSSVAGGLGSLAKSVGVAAAAAGTAAPLLAGVVAAVEQVGPAAAVATTGLLAMQLASGALKLGMLGVSDAITEAFKPDADAAKVAEALERLSPAARETARQIIGMKDAFKDLQLDVQETLFKGFAGEVKGLATNVLPDLKRSLVDTAGSLNQMGKGVSQAAQALSDSGVLGHALKSATSGLENLVDIPGQATIAFGQLAAAAGPSFERITEAVGRVAENVSKSLSGAFKSGALESAITDAVDAIAQLGRVAGNVFGGIGNIINAVSIDGQGLFGTLETLTQGFEDVTGTDEFQAALSALAETMAVLYKTAGPLLATSLKIVAGVLKELSEPAQVLIKVLGEQFGKILEELGPVLEELAKSFGKLVVSLTPVIELAGQLIADILPILTPLFKSLGVVFEEMAPFVEQVAGILGSLLLPVLEKLPGFLEIALVPFNKFVTEIFPVLTEQLERMAPDFEELGKTMGDLLADLAPLVAQFLTFVLLIDEKIIPIVGGTLIGALALLAKTLNGFFKVMDEFVIPVIQTFIDLLQGDFRDGNEAAKKNVVDLTVKVRTLFDGMVNQVQLALSRYVAQLRAKAVEGATAFLNGIRSMRDQALNRISQIPGDLQNALGNLGNLLFAQGASLIGGLVNGIQSKIGQVTSLLTDLTNKIPDWKGPADKDKKLLTPSGEFLMDGLINGIQKSIPRVRAELQGLTMNMPSFAAPSSISAPASGSMVAPNVFVSIGNEAVDQFVTTRVEQVDRRNVRTAAQGVRI